MQDIKILELLITRHQWLLEIKLFGKAETLLKALKIDSKHHELFLTKAEVGIYLF